MTGGESGIPDFTSYTSGITCSSTQKKSGDFSVYCQPTSHFFVQSFSPLTEFYFTMQLYVSTYGSGGWGTWNFRNSGNDVIFFKSVSPNLALTFYVGATAIGTGTALITASSWFLIEVHIILHATAGLIHVRVNGLDDLIYIGNTIASGYSTINEFYHDTHYSTYYLDDIILNDTSGTINNSWLGGAKIISLRPIGPGSLTQWTPSVGANWECVNEAPISATDYVTGSIAGSIDMYDLANLPAGVCSLDTLLGVKVFNSISRSGITVSYLENTIRTNSTNIFSSPIAVPSTAIIQNTIWDLNPVTGVTWTAADINALEVGVKLV
jgi:hypothetical protein